MKKLALAAVASALLLTACGKKEEDTASTNTPVTPAAVTPSGKKETAEAIKADATATSHSSSAPASAPSAAIPAAKGVVAKSSVVGVYTMDPKRSVIPNARPEDLKRMGSTTVEFKQDFTYVVHGKKSDTGTWTLSEGKIMLVSKSGQAPPPPLTVESDGKTLTFNITPDGKGKLVLVRKS